MTFMYLVQQNLSPGHAKSHAHLTSALHWRGDNMHKQHTLMRCNSSLPSCKEYSRSKVTSHMPLKAVIFHRNVVQSPRRVHGAAVGQARLRAGLVCADAPRRSLQPWSDSLQRRETSSGESTASVPCSLLPLPGQAAVAPPPVS